MTRKKSKIANYRLHQETHLIEHTSFSSSEPKSSSESSVPVPRSVKDQSSETDPDSDSDEKTGDGRANCRTH